MKYVLLALLLLGVGCRQAGYEASTSVNVLPSVDPLLNLTLPIISGTVLEGEVLSVTDGTWSGSPTSFTYAWRRDGSPITGATTTSYELVSTDVGTHIDVVVTSHTSSETLAATSLTTILVPAAPSILAANNMVFALGDSRTLDSVRLGSWDSRGAFAWAKQMSMGLIDSSLANVSGVGGAKTSDIIANQLPTALASSAGTVVLWAGTNDTASGSMTSNMSIANIDNMVAQIRAANKIVLILDEAPVDAGLVPASDQTKMLAIRDHLRTLHKPYRGVYVAGSWNAIATVADGLIPNALAYRDGIHNQPIGAWQIGNVILSSAIDFLPARDIFTRPSPIINGFVGGGSGTMPSGWGFTPPTGVTYTFLDIAGVRTMRITAAGVAANTIMTVVGPSTIPAGFTAGTSYVDTCAKVNVHAGQVGLRNVLLQTYYKGGIALKMPSSSVNAADGTDAGSGFQADFPTDSVTLGIHPDAVLLPADATRVQHFFQINVRSTTTGTFVIDISLPQLRAF